jgi:hypothetical protein
MQGEPNKFHCQWRDCNNTFPLESQLFSHVKAHIQITQPISCKWRTCETKPTYRHRGFLNDHIIGHMSKEIISIWCAGCRTGYRNRQALSRHQKKIGCTGSYHNGNYIDNEAPAAGLVGGGRVVTVAPVDTSSIDALQKSNTNSPKKVVKRSLQQMLDQEREGTCAFNSSLDLRMLEIRNKRNEANYRHIANAQALNILPARLASQSRFMKMCAPFA